MSDLQARVQEAFSDGGQLAQAVPGFRARTSQIDMSVGVAKAIESASELVVEAGTGTGKTFAYLVPALLAGKRTLLSTATKNLQDQLFDKDLPLVRAALGHPVTVALLKGRQNYLCHFHLSRALQDARLPSPKEVGYLQKIKQFSLMTRTGDKADCEGVPEASSVWSWVTSNKDNCLGSECPHAGECFVTKARQEALEADIVVVNHHLFLADVALKEEGIAELLPNADVVVFDEAHQLPEIATHLFGKSISSNQCHEFLRDLLVEGRSTAADAGDWDGLIRPLELMIKDIRIKLGVELDSARLSLAQFEAVDGVVGMCLQFSKLFEALIDRLEPLAPRSEAWVKLYNRACELCTSWAAWFTGVGGSKMLSAEEIVSVKWVNISGNHVQFCDSPLEVAQAFGKLYAEQEKAWIFTSATLSVKNDLSNFSQRMGLSQASEMLLPSPFDYESQALLCVPDGLPNPTVPKFSEQLCEYLWPLILASDGGVFFLCTSHRAVSYVGQWFKQRLESDGLDWTLLVQGEASRAELIERYRLADKPVLIGAASFWEGVDIRGDKLRLVIIDKLPFAPPDDPVFQARSEAMRKRGGNPFNDLAIPDAAIALKQGAGRLIRDESDWGVLVIGDRRLVEKGYGKMLWRSLPPFSRSRELQTAITFMNQRKGRLD